MKAIVISEQNLDLAFKAFLQEMRLQSGDHQDDNTKGLSFRTVTYYAHALRQRLESAE